ncbi:DUF2207 domain-containing protein [Aestuariivirga sp.]|uniref:DUF2207 domain-containing protein n=1 Tax=Aestuariivirga sp. TaxID=2650926 RepID=UPI003BA9CEDB
MRRLLALSFGLLLALTAPALAEERILNFYSLASVNADASLDVRETIIVQSEGVDIKHGIYRDFPTAYTDPSGQRVVVGFDVQEVRRDGTAEPFTLEPLSNGTRIKIGDKDVFLNDGVHRYEISYRTTRQIGFFEGYDELYWNVTGNGWELPISAARIAIRLPAGAEISQHAEYTGAYGSKARDVRVLTASGNLFEAVTTAPLQRGEGLTVSVAWQKGLVTPPSDSQKWAWWLSDNAGFFALGLGLIASGLYFLFAWNKVGRDPAKGTIIPLFTPPKGMGPAAVRYVSRYGADAKTFAAAMVGLAVKGRLRIADDGNSFAITKLADSGSEPLTISERALYAALPQGSTGLRQSNHAVVGAAKTALENALKREYDGKVFLRNLGWFAGGLAISVICLIAGALMMPGPDGVLGLFAMGWTAVWWGVILAVGWASIKGLMSARGWAKISSLFGLIVLFPFIGAGVIGPGFMLMQGGGSPGLYVLVAVAVLLSLMNVIFYHLLRAPTETGRRLLDQIEGFKLYLSTAEEDRLNVLNPPEKTPELFERYLPYALALDCENEWNAKFAAVLAAAAAAGAAGPLWYSGNSWDFGRSGSFTNSLGSSLAASAASAATAPGRSSGSGGGGFSGGGGGGGGGGGW